MIFGTLGLLSNVLLCLYLLILNRNRAGHNIKWLALLGICYYGKPVYDTATASATAIYFSNLRYTIALPFSLGCFLLYTSGKRYPETLGKPDVDSSNNEIPFPKPLLFPCRTTHRRFFPKKHFFSYSYLLIGVPVGWQGSIGSLLSVDLDTNGQDSFWRARTWFSIDGTDYLHRDTGSRSLRGKLEQFLKTKVN